jgi:hypothetical protein
MLVGIEVSTTRTKKEGSNKSTCANTSWRWKHSMTMKALYPYRSVIQMNNSRGACGEAMPIYLIQTRQYLKHRAIPLFFFFSNIESIAT